MAYNPQEPHALDHGNLLATLRFSQQAPVILSGKSASGNMPASVPIYKRDGPEEYDIMEQLFLSCLQTGDDQAASQCLERLTCRFGASNERIQGLRGLYQEAVAEKPSDLQECLRHYDEARSEHPLNLVRMSDSAPGRLTDQSVAHSEAPDLPFTFNVSTRRGHTCVG